MTINSCSGAQLTSQPVNFVPIYEYLLFLHAGLDPHAGLDLHAARLLLPLWPTHHIWLPHTLTNGHK